MVQEDNTKNYRKGNKRKMNESITKMMIIKKNFIMGMILFVHVTLLPQGASSASYTIGNRPYARSLKATGREIPFILMPYPIFKDSTGKELHFIGRDKVDLDEDKNVSDDVVAHEKNAQNRRRSLPVPSRKWIIDWKNNGSLKGKFGQRTPTVTFVRAKRRDLKHRKPTKIGLGEANYQKVEDGLQEVKKESGNGQT